MSCNFRFTYLRFLRIPGVVKKWFESYLTGSEQWIMVKTHLSDYFQLNSKMPQGSCLNFYQFFSTLNPSIWPLFVFYVVSSISTPFRRLQRADHIAEGKARPQHQELHALLFANSLNSVWVLLRPTELWTLKDCETGPTVYSPYPRRLVSLNHLQM